MANFDWQDCMPVSDDSTEVYLAKYKRLQYVYQVKSRRLHRHRQAKGDSLVDVGSNGIRAQQPTTAAVTSPAVQPDDVPAAAAAAATFNVLNACLATEKGLKQVLQAAPNDGFDCQTPHHTKLPAPGANIASELHTHQQPQPGHADSIASGQHASTDPIVSTVSHRRPKWRDEVAHRQKGPSKTYATLSLQRASSAATLAVLDQSAKPAMQTKSGKSIKMLPQENHSPNIGQLPRATTAHTQQQRVMHSSAAEQAKHTSAGQKNGKTASHPAVHARQARASLSPSQSVVPDGDQTMVPQHHLLNPESQSYQSNSAALPSSAYPPHRSQTGVSEPGRVMHKQLTQHEQLTGKAQICLQEGSETQPDLQVDCAHGAVLLPQDSNMLSAKSADLEEADRDLINNAVYNRLASSPAQLSCTPRLQPGASDIQTCSSASIDTADCCLDMPGPILAVVAVYRHIAVCIGEPQGPITILMLYLHPGELPKVSGQLSAQASQLPAACELQHCMQLQQFSNQNGTNKHGVDTWCFMDPQPRLTCHLPTPAEPYCLLASSGRLAAAGHGAWLVLWRITIDMQYTQRATMADAQYRGVNFPDIVQLAFLGDTCQYIAGCSSMGSLAIWHARGDLLMVHCNPMIMIQSIHQPLHMAYAAQPHAPSNFVVLAKIQQHETSEHQGRLPQSGMVALLLSSDSVFVGSAMQSKARQIAYLQLSEDLQITAMTAIVDCGRKAQGVFLGTKQGKLLCLDSA